MKKKRTAQYVSMNLNVLKDQHGDSYRTIEKRSGVPKSTVERVLKGDGAISIDTCDDLASAYGLQVWQLMMKNLPSDMHESKTISKLIHSYFHSTPEGREHIARVAERESKYSNKVDEDDRGLA